MSVKLSAVVRDIKVGDLVSTSEWADNFTDVMAEYIGKTIQIEGKYDGTLEWFDGLDNIFSWHVSWLKDFQNVE